MAGKLVHRLNKHLFIGVMMMLMMMMIKIMIIIIITTTTTIIIILSFIKLTKIYNTTLRHNNRQNVQHQKAS